jgi:2-methylcitrate dehydratase
MPLLLKKFENNLDRRFSPEARQRIIDASLDQAALEAMPVDAYVSLYVV